MRKAITIISAVSLLVATPTANAGLLKWAKRGVVACALTQPCRGAVAGGAVRGVGKGGQVAMSRLGPHILNKCLEVPQCVLLIDKALMAGAGTSAGAATWKSIEMWMASKDGDGDGRPDVTLNDRTASIMPDPEDPFGEEESGSREVEFKPKKDSLQHAYDRHKGDWGFTENRNNQVLARYEQRLRQFMREPDTFVKNGLFRGKDVVHFYNRNSRLWVAIYRADGNIAGAWELSKEQYYYLETVGKISTILVEGHFA